MSAAWLMLVEMRRSPATEIDMPEPIVRRGATCASRARRRSAVSAAFACLLLGAAAWAQSPDLDVQIVLQVPKPFVFGPGDSRSFQGIARNTGDTRLPELVLTTGEQTGWTVTFAPQTIESLGPGEEKPFSVEVTAPRTIFEDKRGFYLLVSYPGGALKGYPGSFVAVLRPWRIWATVSAVLAVVVAACFVLIYRRLNRDRSQLDPRGGIP